MANDPPFRMSCDFDEYLGESKFNILFGYSLGTKDTQYRNRQIEFSDFRLYIRMLDLTVFDGNILGIHNDFKILGVDKDVTVTVAPMLKTTNTKLDLQSDSRKNIILEKNIQRKEKVSNTEEIEGLQSGRLLASGLTPVSFPHNMNIIYYHLIEGQSVMFERLLLLTKFRDDIKNDIITQKDIKIENFLLDFTGQTLMPFTDNPHIDFKYCIWKADLICLQCDMVSLIGPSGNCENNLEGVAHNQYLDWYLDIQKEQPSSLVQFNKLELAESNNFEEDSTTKSLFTSHSEFVTETNLFFKSIKLTTIDTIQSSEFNGITDDTLVTNYFSIDYHANPNQNFTESPLDVQVLFVCSFELSGKAKYEAREMEILRNKNNRITVSNSRF